MPDVCIIGHLTKDIIRIDGREKELPGGTAYYLSIALKNLGLNVVVVTKFGYRDTYLLDDLNRNNIPVFLKTNPRTTVFENCYLEHFNRRIQKVSSIAPPFAIEDIPPVSPSLFYIGSLTKGDIPLDLLRFLAKKSMIALDVQGFLRTVVQGYVRLKDWDEKGEALSYIDILKADEMKAKILSGEEDVKRAAQVLSAYGPQEVIITLGSKGSLIYSGGEFYHIPSYPPEIIMDPTGCGNTYMAGYIYKRLKPIGISSDLKQTGRFCAAMASLKLKNYGPFQGSKGEVEHYLAIKGELV